MDRQDRHIVQQYVALEMVLEGEKIRIDQKSWMCAGDAIIWFSRGAVKQACVVHTSRPKLSCEPVPIPGTVPALSRYRDGA